MRVISTAAFVLLVFTSSASAKYIPYYRMDALARISTDIVLCDEVLCVTKKGTPSGDYVPTYSEFTVAVVRSLKGDRKPGERLVVELDSLYTRWLMDSRPRPAEARPIPLGRVLLFLNQRDGVWQPVRCGVKLFIDGEVYCYGQFVSNPGGLWLARMAPENITIPSTETYDEGFLLVDLGAALERAKSPQPDRAREFGWADVAIRRDYQPKPNPAEPPPSTRQPATAETTGWWVAGIGGGFLLLVVLRVIVYRKRRSFG